LLLILAFGLVAILLLGLVVIPRVRAAGSDQAELFAIDHGISPTAEGLELCRRYLSRARQFRFVFSFAGLLVGIVFVPRWLAISWVPGWFVGVIATELFRLRASNRRSPQRTASLEPRNVSRYVAPRLAWHARILAGATILVTVTAIFLPWHSGRLSLVALSVGTVAVLATAEACQHAVAARTRPALPPALEEADDGIRQIGAKAVGYAASGALAVLFGFACMLGFRGTGAPAHLSGTMTAVGYMALVWALALGVVEHNFFWPRALRAGRARRVANW